MTSDTAGEEIAYNDWTEKELSELNTRLWMDMLNCLGEKISIPLLDILRRRFIKDGI